MTTIQYNIKHNPKYVFGSVFLNPKVQKALLVDKKGLKLFAKMMSKKPRSAFNFIHKQSEYYKHMLCRILGWQGLLAREYVDKENMDVVLNDFINLNERKMRNG